MCICVCISLLSYFCSMRMNLYVLDGVVFFYYLPFKSIFRCGGEYIVGIINFYWWHFLYINKFFSSSLPRTTRFYFFFVFYFIFNKRCAYELCGVIVTWYNFGFLLCLISFIVACECITVDVFQANQHLTGTKSMMIYQWNHTIFFLLLRFILAMILNLYTYKCVLIINSNEFALQYFVIFVFNVHIWEFIQNKPVFNDRCCCYFSLSLSSHFCH